MTDDTSCEAGAQSGEVQRQGALARAEARPIDGEAQRLAKLALADLRYHPPLGGLAAGAAALEVMGGRLLAPGLVRASGPVVTHALAFPRTLSAVCGLITFLFAVVAFIRWPGTASPGRRLVVATFAGVFVPCLVLAAAVSAASLHRQLIILGLAAAHLMAIIVGLSALPYRTPPSLRSALLAVVIACAASVSAVATFQLQLGSRPSLVPPADLQRIRSVLLASAEVAWLCVLVGASFHLLGRSLRRWAVALVIAPLPALALLSAGGSMGLPATLVFYATFHLSAFPSTPLLYAGVVGVAAGAAFVGVLRGAPPFRQLALGLVFWLAAGASPVVPIRLLYLALSVLLMARCAQVLDPDGGWSRRRPWRVSRRHPAPTGTSETGGGLGDSR